MCMFVFWPVPRLAYKPVGSIVSNAFKYGFYGLSDDGRYVAFEIKRNKSIVSCRLVLNYICVCHSEERRVHFFFMNIICFLSPVFSSPFLFLFFFFFTGQLILFCGRLSVVGRLSRLRSTTRFGNIYGTFGKWIKTETGNTAVVVVVVLVVVNGGPWLANGNISTSPFIFWPIYFDVSFAFKLFCSTSCSLDELYAALVLPHQLWMHFCVWKHWWPNKRKDEEENDRLAELDASSDGDIGSDAFDGCIRINLYV